MEMPRLPRRLMAALLLPLAAAPLSSHADNSTWNDSTGNHLWSDAANWSNGLPGTAYTAEFSGTGSTVTLTANQSSAFSGLLFNGSDASYTFQSDILGTVRNLSGSGSFQGAYGTTDSSLTLRDVNIGVTAGSSFAYNGSGNTLLLSGSGTRLATAYSAGFSVGSGNGTAVANSNNTVTIQSGATLQAGLISIGGKGDGNSIVVTGTDSLLGGIGLSGQTNFNLNIGNSTSTSNNLQILNGGKVQVNYWNTNLLGGYLVIGKGSMLVHNSTAVAQSLNLSSRGTLYGAGDITATYVKFTTSAPGGSGAQVHIGETSSDYGALTANLRGPSDAVGEWQNDNLTLNFQVGDLTTPDGAIAGENYDFLDLSGNFVYGGIVNIDLANALLAPSDALQLIRWSGALGDVADLSVNLLNGGNYGYELRSDGLYLTASIPEPGTVALAALGLTGLWFGARHRRR